MCVQYSTVIMNFARTVPYLARPSVLQKQSVVFASRLTIDIYAFRIHDEMKMAQYRLLGLHARASCKTLSYIVDLGGMFAFEKYAMSSHSVRLCP